MPELKKYDLYSQDFKANAYDTYAQLRAEDPVRLHAGLTGTPIWFVTGYDEAETVLRDHKRFVKSYYTTLPEQEREEARAANAMFRLTNQHMLNMDPPDHTRLRALVNKAFTTRRVNEMQPRIQTIADDLIDAVQDQGHMDLIDDFAFPLPITVIAEMLGVPTSDRDKFREWSNAFITPAVTEDEVQQFMALMHAFTDYLGRMFAERHQTPRDDLITALLQAEEAGDSLSEEELFSMVILLLIAGHETTVNLIGNGMLALLRHPDQLQKLKNDPALIDTAVEELLRYDGPAERATTRFAVEDVELGGHQIKRGEPVIVVLAAADHDPNQFTQPEQLNISRSDNRHLGFGKGIHYCLGAPLARMEGSIAINTLLRRLPNLRLAAPADDLKYRLSPLIRGLLNLPVAWDVP